MRRVVGEGLLAGGEAQEGTTNMRYVVADCPLQHRITSLKCIQPRGLSARLRDFQVNLAVPLGQHSQMIRQHDANQHESVCASTESTAGRSRTIACQWSPASEEP